VNEATAGVTAVGEDIILSCELESEEEEGLGEAEKVGFLLIVSLGRIFSPMRRSAGVRRVVGSKSPGAGRCWSRVIRDKCRMFGEETGGLDHSPLVREQVPSKG
jgi:hypothetical protein